MEAYQLHLETYDGPLDLLYDLVIKSKIDIKEINILDIITQYMEYIHLMHENNIEVYVEFLTMATRLLNIKSNTLLNLRFVYDDEDEEDNLLKIEEQLNRYIVYKNASLYLKETSNFLNKSFYRVKEDIVDLNEKITVEDFNSKYIYSGIKMLLDSKKTMAEIEINKELVDEKLNTIYRGSFIPVEEKMKHISKFIDEIKVTKFSEIPNIESKDSKIAAFLALLELSKAKYILAKQEEVFKEIVIEKNENILVEEEQALISR